jgi:hypothetical protein
MMGITVFGLVSLGPEGIVGVRGMKEKESISTRGPLRRAHILRYIYVYI